MATISVTAFEAGLSATVRAELAQSLKDGVSGGTTLTGPVPLTSIPTSLLDMYEIIFLAGLRAAQTQVGMRLPSYAKSSLPTTSPAGMMIFVTDDTGGAVPAFSDGSNWRRVTDRAIIS